MNQFPKLIATFFGLGYISKAPGTFGASGGFLLSYCLLQSGLDFQMFHISHIFFVITAYFSGVWACSKLADEWGHDPSRVVIDETMGFWISILFLPLHFYVLLTGFILFRFFDIIKPFGIKKIDQLKSHHSVMLDDVVAGIYSNITLQIILYFGKAYF